MSGALYALPGGLVAEVIPYDNGAKRWLSQARHYLDNPPPGCLLCLAVRRSARGLCGVEISEGPLLGICVLGRPSARALPQDGTIAEVVRLFLSAGLPHGTASALPSCSCIRGAAARRAGADFLPRSHAAHGLLLPQGGVSARWRRLASAVFRVGLSPGAQSRGLAKHAEAAMEA